MPLVTKMKTLHELFLTKLMALYDIEDQLVKALPKMVAQATNRDLKEAFASHLEETKMQIERLEECFSLLKEKPKKIKVEAIRGLVKDAQWVIKHVQKGPALDANLIAAAQYVEHYEIAGYGTAAAWADSMEHMEVADLLTATLHEEQAADEKLSALAESKINDEVPMHDSEE
jgi:ferritin-like metal-binding protein YciE